VKAPNELSAALGSWTSSFLLQSAPQQSAEISPFGALEPGIGAQVRRSPFDGGGVAGPRDRLPDLGPAQSPLAWPLPPTGGDALTQSAMKVLSLKLL
jgi:hypothetical protein